jgi:O-succinylhomoserine sulfhydrylase
MTKTPSDWNIGTQLVRGGTLRSSFGETSEAIFMNSGFCYDSAETAESRFNGVAPGYVYSRYLNPTLDMLEKRLALLEKAERACVMASGMAAVFASIMCQVKAGDHVVSSRALFGSCYYIVTQLLPRYGVEVTLVDGKDNAAWEQAFRPNTVCVFIESPSNPTLELIDIRHVAALSKKAGACLIVDNIFPLPCCSIRWNWGLMWWSILLPSILTGRGAA